MRKSELKLLDKALAKAKESVEIIKDLKRAAISNGVGTGIGTRTETEAGIELSPTEPTPALIEIKQPCPQCGSKLADANPKHVVVLKKSAPAMLKFKCANPKCNYFAYFQLQHVERGESWLT